jgi:hypothetical protein
MDSCKSPHVEQQLHVYEIINRSKQELVLFLYIGMHVCCILHVFCICAAKP